MNFFFPWLASDLSCRVCTRLSVFSCSWHLRGSTMTEGTAVRTKRMGARFFKNPPQPHMCIRDSLKGCPDPCYVNVLSWEKVALGMSSEGVQLYGGMKVCPPRTEKKKKVAVFAVMANPEILRLHGKNARNPKERAWLINILLDFVEKMNEGVVFNRLYTVLRDRDITGELKEIWMIVQSERAKAQQVSGTDELRRPVPQYAQYQEQQQQLQQLQQQQQQQQQQLQQQPHSMSHHQHPMQQLQPMQHRHEEYAQQPPQYQSSGYYAPESSEKCESYELSYGRQTQNIMISMKDRMYQSGPVAQQYHGNDSRVDRYIFRDPIVPASPQGLQQNCLGYPAYQYPQLTRPMGPPFPPNIHPNAIMNCPPHAPNPMTLVRPEPPIHYNKFYERINRMPPPPQPQSPQIQLDHTSPTGYYDPQNRPPANMSRVFWPRESRTDRRSANHVTETISVVTVDMRDTAVESSPPPPEEVTTNLESSGAHISTLQQPHFAVMTPPVGNAPVNLPSNLSSNTSLPRDQNSKKPSTMSCLKLFRTQEADVCRKDTDNPAEDNTIAVIDNTTKPRHSREDCAQFTATLRTAVEQQRTRDKKIKVLKRNKSLGDQKVPPPGPKVTINDDIELRQEFIPRDQTFEKGSNFEDQRNALHVPEVERNGNADKQRTETTRLAKTTTSLRNTMKIVTGGGSGDEVGCKKKANGQLKSQTGKDNSDDVSQVYTILRKPEATTSKGDVTSDMSRLSMKDCEEAGEVGSVFS